MLVLGNGKVITRDAACPLIENGAVAIDGTTICKVGSAEEVRKAYPEAEYIDAKGGLIMPGFINVHEHIYSAFARGLSIKGYDPKGFLDILDGQWWTIDRNLTLHDTYLSAMATYIDCIRNGVTTIFDHHASFGSIRGSLLKLRKRQKRQAYVPASATRSLTETVWTRRENLLWRMRSSSGMHYRMIPG